MTEWLYALRLRIDRATNWIVVIGMLTLAVIWLVWGNQ